MTTLHEIAQQALYEIQELVEQYVQIPKHHSSAAVIAALSRALEAEQQSKPVACQPGTMKTGGLYNWKGQPERLIYIGRNWSGSGFWHQFEKVGAPGVVWCEVLDADLRMLEETHPQPAQQPDNPATSDLEDSGCRCEPSDWTPPVGYHGDGSVDAMADDAAVDRFAAAMKLKMAKQRKKGYGGWDDRTQCPTKRLQAMLSDHIRKGDPVDVGNFAMMLFCRGDRTGQPTARHSTKVKESK